MFGARVHDEGDDAGESASVRDGDVDVGVVGEEEVGGDGRDEGERDVGGGAGDDVDGDDGFATTTTGARDDDDDRSGRCGGCGR